DRQRPLARAQDPALIDIVAVVIDEIEFLLGDAAIGRKESVLVTLTPGERKADLRDRRPGGRQRTCAPDLASLHSDRELIEVVARGTKPVDSDMDGVAEFWMRDRASLAYHLAHAGVCGHRPIDFDRPLRHATAAFERVWRDLRPQHEPVRGRIAAGDAEPER